MYILMAIELNVGRVINRSWAYDRMMMSCYDKKAEKEQAGSLETDKLF